MTNKHQRLWERVQKRHQARLDGREVAFCMCEQQVEGSSVIEAIDACPNCKPKLDAARVEQATERDRVGNTLAQLRQPGGTGKGMVLRELWRKHPEAMREHLRELLASDEPDTRADA